MTNDKARKIAARQLAAATGQSYTVSLRQVTDLQTTAAPPGQVAELGAVGQRVRVRQGVAYDYVVTAKDYSGLAGIVRHVTDAERARFCHVELEDGVARAVLPVFNVADLEAAPVLWEDDHGQKHELLPVGTRIRYTGEVALYPDHPATVYDGALGWVIGHDLRDEVTPYYVRIDDDGERFLAAPHVLTPAPWWLAGDLVSTPVGKGRVEGIEEDLVIVRLNAERIPGETHRSFGQENLPGLHHVDEAGNQVPASFYAHDLAAPACGAVTVVDDLAVFCNRLPRHTGNHVGGQPVGGGQHEWHEDDDVEPEQCCDHDWASDEEREAGHISIHVCVLESGHKGKCVCLDCDVEFDGGVIQDDRWGATDMVGRPLPEWARG